MSADERRTTAEKRVAAVPLVREGFSGLHAQITERVLAVRATHHEVGLLLNFGPKPQFKRFILENERKKIRVLPHAAAVEALGNVT